MAFQTTEPRIVSCAATGSRESDGRPFQNWAVGPSADGEGDEAGGDEAGGDEEDEDDEDEDDEDEDMEEDNDGNEGQE